jgi:hypothetical protein
VEGWKGGRVEGCQVSGVRCQVSGVRCQVSGVRCQEAAVAVGGGELYWEGGRGGRLAALMGTNNPIGVPPVGYPVQDRTFASRSAGEAMKVLLIRQSSAKRERIRRMDPPSLRYGAARGAVLARLRRLLGDKSPYLWRGGGRGFGGGALRRNRRFLPTWLRRE